MRVFIYRNLNKKCLSLKALEGPMKGRIIGYADWAVASECTFSVSQAGRARVLIEKHKNVHAGIVANLQWFGLTKHCPQPTISSQTRVGDFGCQLLAEQALIEQRNQTLLSALAPLGLQDLRFSASGKISYDPYKFGYFFDAQSNPVTGLPACWVSPSGIIPAF